MPSGSYWPDMQYNITIGNPSATQTSSAIDFIKGEGRLYFSTGTSSTCREILSNGIRHICLSKAKFILENNVAGSNLLDCHIRIEKEFPSSPWVSLWAQNIAWPGMFRRINKESGEIYLSLTKKSVVHYYMEAPMSYSLFFLNRHEDFSIEEMSNPLKLIQKILKFGDSWFSGGSQIGYQSLLTAYAVYYLLVGRGNRELFHGPEDNSGLVSYMVASQFCARTAPVFMKFVKDCEISDRTLKCLESTTRDGETAILDLYRFYNGAANKSEKATW